MDVNLPIYKYMKRRHVNSFMKDGTIRVGTLYDFRNEEKHGAEIGDKDEGTKTLTTDGYHCLDTVDPNTFPPWYKKHFEESIKVQGGGRLQFHARDGFRLKLTVPDRFVFCASHEFDGALIENGEYDACLKINYPLEFFNSLTNKMKHKAAWLGMGYCTYRPRLILGENDMGHEPSLIKEERYAYQKEVRSAWEASSDEIHPFILKAKKARKYCEVICA